MATPIIKNLDINLNYPTNYLLHLINYPDFFYYVTDAQLPDISLGNVTINTPTFVYNFPGDSIDLSDLTITFLVDESFTNYRHLLNWMFSLKEYNILPNNIQSEMEEEIKRFSKDMLSIADFHVLTNKKNISSTIRFYGVYPSSLSGIAFSSKMGSDALVCDLTLKFTNFEFIDKE